MYVSWSSVRFVAQRALRLGVWHVPLTDAFAEQAQASSSFAQAWQAHWTLRRATAFTPRQMGLSYLGLCASVIILSWIQVLGLDAIQVVLLAFCLSALGLVLLGCARHATDCDVIALKPDLLRVERHRGGLVERTEFNPRWVRIEPFHDERSLVCLSGERRKVTVGAFVERAQRRQLADEFRWALRRLSAD